MNSLVENNREVFVCNKEKVEIETLKSLRKFGFSITHEMRTPLSTISMLCRLINMELSNEDIDKEKVWLIVKKLIMN